MEKIKEITDPNNRLFAILGSQDKGLANLLKKMHLNELDDSLSE
jgi:hypothetical protein